MSTGDTTLICDATTEVPTSEYFFRNKIARSYQLLKNRPVFSDEEAAAELKGKKSPGRSIHSWSYEFNLPYNLTDEWFHRHQPSLSDFHKVLQCTEVKYLWMLAAVNGIKIYTNVTSITKNADGQFTFVYSGNTQFRKKIDEFVMENKKLSPVNKMIARNDAHKPLMMLHFFPQEVLDSIPPPKKLHTFALHWRGADFVLSEYYKGYYKFNAVEPIHLNQKFNKEPDNLISQSDEYLINGIVCRGTKEFFLGQTEANHLAIMAVGSSRDLREFENAPFRLPKVSPYDDRSLTTSSPSTVAASTLSTSGKGTACPRKGKSKSKSSTSCKTSKSSSTKTKRIKTEPAT